MVFDLKYISYTQIGMMLKCSKQWEFRYVKGIKIRPSGAQVQGSAYHGALKENFDNKIKNKIDLKQSDVLDAFDKYWNDSVRGKVVDKAEDEVESDKVDWEDHDPGQLKDEAATLLKLYHARIAPNIQPKSTEKYYERKLPSGVMLIGYLDLETAEETIDHKLKGMSMNQDAANRELQPLIYPLLTGNNKFTFHVAIKKKVPEIQVVKVNKSMEEVEWWLKGIEQVISQIKTGIFPPNPTGWWCGEKWCGYYDLCHGGSII